MRRRAFLRAGHVSRRSLRVIWARNGGDVNSRWSGRDVMLARRCGGARRRGARRGFAWRRRRLCAHPHVWVTVRSQVGFTPDGKVGGDHPRLGVRRNVFLLRHPGPGQAGRNWSSARSSRRWPAKTPAASPRSAISPRSRSAARRSISRRSREYWMEERPDHLVTFHVVLPAEDADRAGTAISRCWSPIPNFSSISNSTTRTASCSPSAPAGCSASIAKPKPLEAARTSRSSTESFFTNLAPGANFGFKMASRAIIACP